MWSSSDVGLFIDLRAFAELGELRQPDAQLPSWVEVVNHYPQLICDADTASRRLFITHRWDQPPGSTDAPLHPDWSGWQLKALLALSDHYRYRAETKDQKVAFWYDYMSLPQKPRDPAQELIFQSGLRNIRGLVGRCENITLISATGPDHKADLQHMLERGWILFELFIARSHIRIPLPVYEREPNPIAFGRQQIDWDTVVPDVAAVAPTDSRDHIHAWLAEKGVACTNGSDLSYLASQLYDELSSYDHAIAPPSVAYGVQITLSDEEISRFCIRNSCGLSNRFPNIFLKQGVRDVKTGLWTAEFVYRPPLPPINRWVPLADDELQTRMIDAATERSPMYPGIRFEVDPSKKMWCAKPTARLS